MFWSPAVSVRAIHFFPKWDSDNYLVKNLHHVGLSINLEKYFGIYNTTDLVFGIPISLAGKKENRVNFELQLKLNDIRGELNAAKSIWEKRVIGFNVGLPFGNLSK